MKRKKWTEEEESTLISKYSELLRSGTLSKLKTREKKFEPIAQHVNALHHMVDPTSFPFRWSWRDVSIKVQNMRHQFLNVKQKIRIVPSSSNSASSNTSGYNWSDGENHWQNFLKYKQVFGDLDLDPPLSAVANGSGNNAHVGNSNNHNDDDDENDDDDRAGPVDGPSSLLVVDDDAAAVFGYDGFVDGDGSDVLGLGLGIDCEDGFDADRDEEEVDPAVSDGEERDGGEDGEDGDLGFVRGMKRARKDGEDWGGQVLELREMALRREESRREREFGREDEVAAREDGRRERERQREERMGTREFELEERERMWVRWQFERRMRVEEEFVEERRRRMKMEEKREEEEMKWREQMVGMQMEHEKQMMEMYADACHNQMQVLGVLVRLVSQFFGPGGDGLGGGMGGLPSQVLQNLQHPGSLVGENGKADGNSGGHFM
ncbi:uncharacterized protein LOC131240033 [Magnolia sinica]|uniref:uncharacterized protein LOC131240033 n=1 Tax=Magnolia sinica TaxID=86752 RepID=UPI0026596B24|nr:uncharacterized protein LOC131240033 [Magnolia sinica]XP_058094024.1 uncharacterized protein LOC131240033 [Magnolia sinica]